MAEATMAEAANAEATTAKASMTGSPKLKSKRSIEASKLLYILVQDDPLPGAKEGEQGPYHRYTRGLLQSTLQLMGCKARHALKISDQVFIVIKSEMPPKKPKRDRFSGLAPLADAPKKESNFYDPKGFFVSPKPLKKRSTATVPREKFLDVTCSALAKYDYLGVKQRLDLMIACRIREKRSSVTVLLCGTSGCGKSTLATLLGQRLGVTTVVSTDSVRHMMRGFIDEKENPLLWASTYHAGEFLDPQTVTDAIHRKRQKMLASQAAKAPSTLASTPADSGNPTETSPSVDAEGNPTPATENGARKLESSDSLVGRKVMAIEGFKAQSEMVVDSVDRLITAWETKKESVIVEGVHLSINFVMKLMKKHPSIVPFMVYIANESKHMQRFAVRAKYMTLDPAKNKYVKYIKNIRTIQDYLCKDADKHLVPKVNNTNVDKSVAAIHATVFSCLRRREAGEPLLDKKSNSVKVIQQEYAKHTSSSALGSKTMLQLIQRKGSTRNLLAVVNAIGFVRKAWPLSIQPGKTPATSLFQDRDVGTPVVGPFSAGSSEPVRLQFGSLGLSALPEKSRSSEAAGSGSAPAHASAVPPSPGPDHKEQKEDLASGTDDDFDEAEEEIHNEGDKSDIELDPVEENDDEGSVDDDSDHSGGEDEFVEGEEDDAYWDYDENSPTPRPATATGSPGKRSPASKAERMSRLRSFDKAAAGRGAPELRKSVSHTRTPRRLGPKLTL